MVVAACGWTILLAPLVAAGAILLIGVHRKRLSATLAIVGLLVSFGCTVLVFVRVLQGAVALPLEVSVPWVALPDLQIQFGLLLDRLSLLMALVVTGVGSAIFLYSVGYMADDAALSRYFGMLSLFAFSMLLIVLANNWVELFIGWELVGFCSYILIGHWYAKPAAADAGKKAFMVNRVADFAFLLGILALWALSSPLVSERTFQFQLLQERLPALAAGGVVSAIELAVIGLLIFCGVMGKSAQFPLHVWLPDAMEGPTPVSALIHAATMVAAGVYLVCRSFWFFEGLPAVLSVMMWIGGVTAFLSACLALVENDLKRILAYSTLSQLGYMVMALGLGGYIAGMYHLTTHAFFKALLFLAAGSVIHATHTQDIRALGGLTQRMPWTSLAFFVGGLALCGFPGLSGFFSKDEILVLAHEQHRTLYWLGTITAGLTAFYIARAWFVAFVGRGNAEGQRAKVRGEGESPAIMLGPLFLLIGLSILGGYLGIPHFLGQHCGVFHWDVAWISLVVIAGGLSLAWLLYSKRALNAQQVVHALALPASILQKRLYVDQFYAWYVDRIQQRLIARACALFERFIIIGTAVNGTAGLTKLAGRVLRYCQTGMVQTYVLVFLGGVVWLLYSTQQPADSSQQPADSRQQAAIEQ